MDLLEHQGKQLFAKAGLPVMAGETAVTPDEAVEAARELGLPVIVKAQVKTGGRGKAGGVRRCATIDEVEAAATAILGMTIKDKTVESLLIEEAADIAREMYLSISLSRAARGPVLVFAREGGMDIESIARRDPDALIRRPIDPLLGLCDYQVRDVLAAAGVPRKSFAGRSLAAVVRSAWRLYLESDATLLEVNPLALTPDGAVVCLDSKVTVDDSALFRHRDFAAEAEAGLGERETRARRAGLAFVALDGDIGVLGNGAGLVMSTIDQLAAAGGAAADFCDLGGGAKAEVVAKALEVVLAGGHAKAVLVSIFGGITRCDEVARGLVQVLSDTQVDVPVVVRLDGTAAAAGRKILAEAELTGVRVAARASEAVIMAVADARESEGGEPPGAAAKAPRKSAKKVAVAAVADGDGA
jgi:succinyl-CoA synthetase beta subunit